MKPIQVKEVVARGDGLPLPMTVTMEGLTVPGPGTFELLNALVTSNGDIRIVIDNQTRVVPTKEVRTPEQEQCARTLEAELDRLAQIVAVWEHTRDDRVFWQAAKAVSPSFISSFHPRLRYEDRVRLAHEVRSPVPNGEGLQPERWEGAGCRAVGRMGLR